MKKKTGFASKLILALMLIFFYLPIIYIIIYSFNGSKSFLKLDGFSLRWYEKLFSDANMMMSIFYTAVIAVLATAISTVVGTVTAIGLSKSKRWLQKTVEQVNNLPVLNPDIVTAIGLMMLFSALAIEKGFITLLLAHIMFCTPYVMLSVTPKLRTLDPNIMDAAMDLGATPMQALVKAVVPQIMPGILSGALIAFTMSFDDFVISYFVTGNGVSNISIIVYSLTKRIDPSVNALSTIVILLVVVTLTVINIIPMFKNRKDAKKHRTEERLLTERI